MVKEEIRKIKRILRKVKSEKIERKEKFKTSERLFGKKFLNIKKGPQKKKKFGGLRKKRLPKKIHQ